MGLESYENIKILNRWHASVIYSFAFAIAWGGIKLLGFAMIFK